MEEVVSSFESDGKSLCPVNTVDSDEAKSESPSRCELLILHTAEAEEWATYLQKILKSSRKFRKRSIVSYAVGPADQLHGYNFEYFHSSRCTVLLLTSAFLDTLGDPELWGALQRLLHPPHRVVALLCGVSEDDMLTESFEHWPSWRKLYTEDEPTLYISTILEAIADSKREEAEHKSEAPATAELQVAPNPIAEETESAGEKETVMKDQENVSSENSTSKEMSSPAHLACLTVQPSRVLCGDQETIFIILTHKMDNQSALEVEFSSENVAAKRVPGTLENEYTISVAAPDMPAGVVSLTMYTDQSCVSLRPVTYYTNMGQVSRCLENATAPMEFICQAFNITSDITKSLDDMLTDSLKSRMPANGLQLFGIRQIEEDNMAAYQRNEELPTLLHFAAKYGLKKLTTVLLQCPGALQAYSVMNKYGDYPNTLAEKSGFSDLRQFMDDFVETADMLKSHIRDSISAEEGGDVYESPMSQEIIMKYSGCTEDIYESMLGIDPECAEDLYEVMNAVEEYQNPEEIMLRKFFQAKPDADQAQDNEEHLQTEEKEKDGQGDPEKNEEEEDPYNLCPEDIYDTVDEKTTYIREILNRPPAPIPRPQISESDEPKTYISRVFTEKVANQSKARTLGPSTAGPVMDSDGSSVYDPYGGVKTPGQRQLIALQERVKVGAISVDEAVQEFKAWQFDHERRASSLRYQQENLKKLRESITRRHKKREKMGKDLEYEISAPLQRSWGSDMVMECAVYEATPRTLAPVPPVARPIQRGGWKTGSTSSTSSTESNRLSTHSTISYSSGTEPEFEDAIDSIPPPPRPPRPADALPLIPPPRIPPRIPERVPEMLQERYISCPTRALPQRPIQSVNSPPPIPRRTR
uniref:phosphoinositide 3-kinase adapter protein 1 isoform X1 n=1 Tax=Centroberyx gerrardi TaxID=166262 RepID=UPI003AAC3A04